MSNEIYEKLEICRKSILQKTNFKPEVAVILGSGLGEYASKIKIEQIIPYTEIEGFPVSTVVGHKGQFVFGYVKEVPIVIMQGRVHYYEGYPVTDASGAADGNVRRKEADSYQCIRRNQYRIPSGRSHAHHRPDYEWNP